MPEAFDLTQDLMPEASHHVQLKSSFLKTFSKGGCPVEELEDPNPGPE